MVRELAEFDQNRTVLTLKILSYLPLSVGKGEGAGSIVPLNNLEMNSLKNVKFHFALFLDLF